MINPLVSYLVNYPDLTVIEIFSNPAGENRFKHLCVECRKGNLDIVKQQYASTIEELIDKLDNKKPVLLSISAEKVLERIFSNEEASESDEEAIYHIFPNIELEDFYYQIKHCEEYSHIALMRKEDVNIFVSTFEESNFNVIDLALGSLPAENILNQIENKEISISHNNIQIFNYQPEKIKKAANKKLSTEYIEFEGMNVAEDFLLCFSHALIFLTKGANISLNGNLNAYQYKTVRNKLLKYILIAALAFLVISSAFFMYYFQKNQELQQQVSVQQNDLQEVERLKQKLKDRKTLFNSVNINKSNTVSILDNIGASVPKEVILSQLQYQPLIKKFEKGKAIQVQPNQIVIKGTVGPLQTLIQWVNNSLKSMQQIKDVEIIRLQENEIEAIFEILINLNE